MEKCDLCGIGGVTMFYLHIYEPLPMDIYRSWLVCSSLPLEYEKLVDEKRYVFYACDECSHKWQE